MVFLRIEELNRTVEIETPAAVNSRTIPKRRGILTPSFIIDSYSWNYTTIFINKKQEL
jgi:hypothetical protein